MEKYTDIVLNHFEKPRNVGEVKKYNAFAMLANSKSACGDTIKLTLKIENNIIKDIKFQTLGCVAAMAASSMLTCLAKNKTLDQALKITDVDVVKALGGIPAKKLLCSNFAASVLHQAIREYLKKIKI